LDNSFYGLGRNQAWTVNADADDSPLLETPLELARNTFDFGQFRHARRGDKLTSRQTTNRQ
jgi:hypothetical protein